MDSSAIHTSLIKVGNSIICLNHKDGEILVKLIEDRIHQYLDTGSKLADELESAVQRFCDLIEAPSLNVKVNSAVVLRNQGHFNNAMLMISEANRDQVIAIRKIQRIIDEVNATDIKEVAFSRYRQFLPLEIGIENGEEVIELLDEKLVGEDTEILEFKGTIHSCELQKEAERERLSFFEKRFGNEAGADEINKMRETIASIDAGIAKHKGVIIKKIFYIVNELFTEKPALVDRDKKFLELSWNIFFVFLSPIATKHADRVDVAK